MNIQIHGQNFTITPAIRNQIEKKYASIEKIVSPIDRVHVSISVNRHHKHGEIFTVSSQIAIGKNSIHVTEKAEDVYTAIDKSEEIILRQTKKYKTKHQMRLRRLKRLISPRNYWRWGKNIFNKE
ncbi:ribosome hibernation-promoting factor, HPF/YfiA family [Patescibacteria group bacterium]